MQLTESAIFIRHVNACPPFLDAYAEHPSSPVDIVDLFYTSRLPTCGYTDHQLQSTHKDVLTFAAITLRSVCPELASYRHYSWILFRLERENGICICVLGNWDVNERIKRSMLPVCFWHHFDFWYIKGRMLGYYNPITGSMICHRCRAVECHEYVADRSLMVKPQPTMT